MFRSQLLTFGSRFRMGIGRRLCSNQIKQSKKWTINDAIEIYQAGIVVSFGIGGTLGVLGAICEHVTDKIDPKPKSAFNTLISITCYGILYGIVGAAAGILAGIVWPLAVPCLIYDTVEWKINNHKK